MLWGGGALAEVVAHGVAIESAVAVALQSAAAGSPSDLVLFIGRFHPLLVHLPIGFLLLAFLLELFGRFERYKDLGNAVSFSLFLGGLSAVGAAGTGYLLSMDGGYGEGVLSIHMWLGIAVALLSLAAFVLRQWYYENPKLKKVYTGVLAAMVLCLVSAGHYGGSLTHGSDYLVQYMPEPLRPFAGLPPKEDRGIPKIENIDSARVFQDVIHPILDTRCVSCHNPEKKKGELLLTTYENMMEGGESGPPLKAGSADSSDLVHRLLLPEADDDHMPPEGKMQLTGDQVDLITWWIDQGAPMDLTISEMQVPEDISEALNKLTVEGTSFLAKTEVPKADTSVINNLKSQGIKISPIAQETNFLQVKYPSTEDSVNLQKLTPISEQITWLDLANTKVSDQGLSHLAEFTNLTRLNLEQTSIADSAMAIVSSLEHLEYLNAYQTDVSDEGLQQLQKNKSLTALYIWQTNVTDEGVNKLQEKLTELYIDTGWGQATVDSTTTKDQQSR
ncbi:DUF2231 domain-containing protein [Halalkalibaculum sp. DA3122]|uniref:DUF2231 domain-containing protein n=1 Tax=Halalkalibaculum sp. DA3122 TaxID=3373607 RepID=UPI003754BA97